MGNNLYSRIEAKFQERKLKPYYEKIKLIRQLPMKNWSDIQIRRCAREMKLKAQSGAPLEDLMIQGAALVAEAVWRFLQIRLFDVQLAAGLALCDGYLVEMQTGEGKTLAAILPAYLQALQRKGAHIFTFNDYLARRDAEWMGPVYRGLGLSVGYVAEGQHVEERKAAYAADITYLSSKQACFDYLKDSLVYTPAHKVQRPLHCVLVDEADSILIDEARIPLVIAGETDKKRAGNREMPLIVKQLIQGPDYDTDEHGRNVHLTEAGALKVEVMLKCGNLYESRNSDTLAELHCALHAEALLKKDVDYIVRDGAVLLIDEFTGRIAENRHWPDGLQTAVEAKEGLSIQSGGKILGTMTLQHFLSLYARLCGMTATALSSADEFRAYYALDVMVIPPHHPCRRIDYPHVIFTHREAQRQAILSEISAIHKTKQPILIGTASVQASCQMAADLQNAGIPCNLLNAQNDQWEAELIARAGRLNMVTVSTHMAGRGVDIILGGGDAEEYWAVKKLGGLYVIGTNLHESVRVDQQLRGRAGRQGDPGSSRYMISLEDDLLVRFGLRESLPKEYQDLQQDSPLKGSRICNLINHIQLVMDGQHIEIRKTLNKYADLIEQQRRILFKKREALLGEFLRPTLLMTRVPAIYEQLCRRFGKKGLRTPKDSSHWFKLITAGLITWLTFLL